MTRRLSIRPWLAAILVLSLAILIFRLPPPHPKLLPHGNQLAIGKLSDLSGPMAVTINPTIEFDFKKRSEILKLRAEAVCRHMELIKGQYVPSEAVFGGIKDSRPWWGLAGYHFYWKGKNSIKGASKESRYVMNPFLLVAAHLYGDSLYTLVYDQWEKSRSSNAARVEDEIPSYSQAANLTWWPKAGRIEVIYNLTGFFKRMYHDRMERIDFSDVRFDLVAYNARDMNLHYLYVSLATSTNIAQERHSANPVMIRHFLHNGGSCGYPGGCNNMSPDHPAVQDLKILKLPALLEVFLWEKHPASLKVNPGMIVTLKFI